MRASLGHHQQVAAQGDVAAARHRIAVHLGDGGLGAFPQRHEVLGVALHVGVVVHRVPGVALLLAGVVDLAFAELAQVVAAAKALAGAFDHDHVHLVVGIGPLDRRADLARRVVVDGVQALGPVQQQAGDARVAGVLVDAQGVEAGHGVGQLDGGGSRSGLSDLKSM
jgi:hypothetical protein